MVSLFRSVAGSRRGRSVLLLCVLSLFIWLGLRNYSGSLYCIRAPGTVWNGLAALPEGWEPTCPASRSYRQEVRRGDSRVEQYRLPGWQPLAARDLLGKAGYRLVEDELHMPEHYSAFLGRTTPAELHLTAVREGQNTLVTVSGAP